MRIPVAIAVLLTLAACSGSPRPAVEFRVAILVDTATDPVSREQAEAVLALASEKLIDLAGFSFRLTEFLAVDGGGTIEDMVVDYMDRTSDLPNGLLIFSVGDDDRAKINRAYAQQVPAPEGFRNDFVSPVLGDGYMYVAILQFNHHYAACGYAGTDTVQSPFSSHGECRGVDGEACVMWSGMQVCPVALPFLEGRTPIDMAAEPIVHEFVHPFGSRGPEDHYGSEACNLAMGWPPEHYDEEEAARNAGFCPDVFEAFANSHGEK